jgi:hypothetical protein
MNRLVIQATVGTSLLLEISVKAYNGVNTLKFATERQD